MLTLSRRSQLHHIQQSIRDTDAQRQGHGERYCRSFERGHRWSVEYVPDDFSHYDALTNYEGAQEMLCLEH